MAIVRAGDLDIDVDMVFQRRSWIVQRVGWVVMTLLVVGAALGLLGPGPLSRATVSLPGVLEADYQRFTRYEDLETLTVRVAPAVTTSRVVRLSVNREYLDHAQITTVTPHPERVEAAHARVIYVFRVAERGRPLDVTFNLKPRNIGRVEARLAVESPNGRGPELTMRQFAFP
jgi:hypothetical protein